MISFIWSPGNPLPAGTGGSENYTIGQVRELNRRGVPAQVVTVGLGTSDGRDEFTGIPFLSLLVLSEVGELDSTVVFVNEPHPVPTRYPAFLILHNPPPIREEGKAFAVEGTRERVLIATSRYAAALWSAYLDVDVSTIKVVYPFAEPCFAGEPRPGNETGKTRVLFAGRLSPEKGIYTLLETLHIDIIEQDPALTFTATTAGAARLTRARGAFLRPPEVNRWTPPDLPCPEATGGQITRSTDGASHQAVTGSCCLPPG